MRGRRSGLATALSAAIGVLFIAVGLGRPLLDFVSSSPRLSQWDMAKYATSGQRLAESLAEFDLLRFLAEIHDLSVWPPTYPLLEVPVFWIWGLGAPALRQFQVCLFMAMLGATWWALRRLDPRFGDAAGLAAAAAVASSPLIAGLATVNMLEVPGLFLLALACGAYLRALDAEAAADSRRRRRWWRATWLLTLGLFLCKYNYGLLWLLPVILCEARRRHDSWRDLGKVTFEFLSRLLSPRALWRPWPIFVATMVLLIAMIRWTGGIDSEILGLRLRATSPGGPAQALYVAIWLRLLLPWRRARAFWRRVRELRSSDRLFVQLFALPVAIWLLPPPHLKDFLFFLDNRDQGPSTGSWQWWLYYPRQALEAYGQAWVGLLILGLAAVGLVAGFFHRATARDETRAELPKRLIIGLGAAVAAAALLAHPYKLPRFAVSLWWWLAVGAAVGLVTLFSLGAAWRPRWPWRASALALSLGLATGLSFAGVDMEKVRAEHDVRTVDAASGELLAAFIEPTADGEIPGTLVLGTWNRLSPHLLEWHGRASGVPAGRLSSDFEVARRKAWKLIDWLESQPVDRLFILERPGDVEFEPECLWLEPVRAWIDGNSLYVPVGRRDIAGYRVLLYEASSSTSPPSGASTL